MMRKRGLGFVLLVLLASAAEARVYTVTLENGKTFETRYPPTVFDDQPNLTRILTDQGNWIAVETRAITDVESREESGGFGRELDSSTRFLGWIVVEDTDETVGPTDPPLPELPEPPDPRTHSIERFLGPRALDPDEPSSGIPIDLYGDFYEGYFTLFPGVVDPP